MRFALITEGASEHRIIRHIILKYFREYDPDINQIQPKLINEKQITIGGWNEVLKYCERKELKDILVENDYLIIQIDTDQSQQEPFSINHSNYDNSIKTSDQLYHEVCDKLRNLMSSNLNNEDFNKVIFAVCIHTTECWLLPIYYANNQRNATTTCISRLNTALRRQNIPTISPNNKNSVNSIRIYEAILRNWRNRNDIAQSAIYNSGFNRFIQSLNDVSTEK